MNWSDFLFELNTEQFLILLSLFRGSINLFRFHKFFGKFFRKSNFELPISSKCTYVLYFFQ